MNLIDHFWLSNFSSVLKEFEIDLSEFNEYKINESLKNIRSFISTNYTNKTVIIQKTDVGNKLLELYRRICKEQVNGAIFPHCFTDELLNTLNSLATVGEFRAKLIEPDFIQLLISYIIYLDGQMRKNSILLFRTLLNARNIHTCLSEHTKIHDILKKCITQETMNHLTVIPCLSLNYENGSLNPSSVLDKRTGLLVLEMLSVLATDGLFNSMMFSSQVEYLIVLHQIMMELNFDNVRGLSTISIMCAKADVKYILKIIAFYLFYNADSINQLLSVFQCDKYSELINCYEFVKWIDDKYIVPLLGLVRGLIFWRASGGGGTISTSSSTDYTYTSGITIRPVKVEAITNSGETVVSIGLGLTLEDIVKNVIDPLTQNDSYLEFNGMGSWLLHALFLVLKQHFSLSDLLMQCNGFLATIDLKMTPRIKPSTFVASTTQTSVFSSTMDTINVRNLTSLFKLLAWMAAESDSVKISVGNSQFLLTTLECYQQEFGGLLEERNISGDSVLYSDKKNGNGTNQTLDIATDDEVTKPFMVVMSDADLDFQKSIWLLIQALSRSISLHRTFFRKLARYSKFIKQVVEAFINLALQQAEDEHNSFISSKGRNTQQEKIIEIIRICLSAVANLILPTSPLRNELLEWAVEKFIDLTNGRLAVLSSGHMELKLCGLAGLVNAAYSLVSWERFVNTKTDASDTSGIDSGSGGGGVGGSQSQTQEHDHDIEHHFPDVPEPTREHQPTHYQQQHEQEQEQDQQRRDPEGLQEQGVRLHSDQQTVQPPPPPPPPSSMSLPQQQQHQQHDLLRQSLSAICTHLIANMPSTFGVLPEFGMSLENVTSSSSSSNNMAGDIDSMAPVLTTTSNTNTTTIAAATTTTTDNITKWLHDRCILMVWALFRNTMHSICMMEQIFSKHGLEIINFIVSTLESNYSNRVKEQALIVLGHLSTYSEFREQVLANEDLMEKLKLFSRSVSYRLKVAAIFASFYIGNFREDDRLKFIEESGSDFKEFINYLESISQLEPS